MAEVEVDEMLRLFVEQSAPPPSSAEGRIEVHTVSDKASKIPAHYAMPRRTLFRIKLRNVRARDSESVLDLPTSRLMCCAMSFSTLYFSIASWAGGLSIFPVLLCCLKIVPYQLR